MVIGRRCSRTTGISWRSPRIGNLHLEGDSRLRS
uniref:Uncharacterized protein n=1 Tax=Arundo donax TaxID=35708 RepID=A0A0A9F1W1_ARUDO